MSTVTVFFWVFLAVNVVWWLHELRQHARTHGDVAADWSPKPHPCAHNGHGYVQQPTVWRCPQCGDTCTVEDVYDQDCIA